MSIDNSINNNLNKGDNVRMFYIQIMFKRKEMIKMKNLLTQKHSGAVAFEYIIILVIMAVATFAAWGILSTQVQDKAQKIADFIAGNGQNALG